MIEIILVETGVNVAETIKALTEIRHTPASPNSIRRMSSSTQNIYNSLSGSQQNLVQQNTSPILSSFQGGVPTKLSYISQSGGVIYAQPSVPGSPNAIKRVASIRSQSADRKSVDGTVYVLNVCFFILP